MQTVVISKDEKAFHQSLLAHDIRLDGRAPLVSRQFKVEINPLPLSPSSCRVTWGYGYGDTTEVMVSVSTEIMKEEQSLPQISVKALSGSFGIDFDPTEICQVVNSTLEQFLKNSGALDPSQFVIVNSPYSWKIFIDVLIYKAAGAVYEAAMIGIRESLSRLTFPQLIVTPGETISELHFDIDENKEELKLIDPEKLPYVLSFAVAPNSLFLDPTPIEISVVQSLLVIGVSKAGSILGLNHFGERGLKTNAIEEITNNLQMLLSQQMN
ncbi:exosome complex component RRP42 [Histomonas meleagridis]|uniref:exosome complex component RRP42 n=1 Tax=Histomonas meleagridis TaxID=135588 RepID=UPI0035594D22|nr:exosome complex component RRP42 [Histomonas meleagridis]KAH0800505.1 exosome complex component RRP42 [Histomonas meleagridis]